MKKRGYSILTALALGLAASSTSYAMSEFVALSIEPQWPTTTNPGTVIVYKVTAIGRAGQGMLEVVLSSAGLPAGATVSFSPNMLRFTGQALTNQTSIMTVTCPTVMPTDTYPFTVTGTARRESITITNEFVQPLYGMISGPAVLIMDPPVNGSLRLRGKGSTGQTYLIESTFDLANPIWTPFGTTTADGNGRFTLPAGLIMDAPKRFFRAVWSSAN